jgi:hypothetical protein
MVEAFNPTSQEGRERHRQRRPAIETIVSTRGEVDRYPARCTCQDDCRGDGSASGTQSSQAVSQPLCHQSDVQSLQTRGSTPCRQPRESSQERLKRARESQVWPQASQHVGRAPEGVRWVRVADREADICEYLVCCQEQGYGFVIRAANDCALSHPETGKRAERLFTVARSAVPVGEFTLA